MGQESEGYLSNSSQRLLRATGKVLARIVVSSKGFVEGVLASKLTCAAVGRIQFLGNHWPEGLISSLAVGWRPPSVPYHTAFSTGQTIWQVTFLKVSRGEKAREN